MRNRFMAAAAIALLAYARARGASCDNTGFVVNGFEGLASGCGTPNDIIKWVVSAGATLNPITPGAGTNAAIDGTHYGRLQWSLALTTATLTMNAPFPMGADWSSYEFLAQPYATTDTALAGAGNYTTSLYLNTTANGSVLFEPQTTNLTRPAGTVAVAGWAYQIISLNYARNLGLDLTSMLSVSVEQNNPVPPGIGNGNISYDYLRLYNGSGVPNAPVNVTQVGATVNCGGLTLTWTAQVQSGSDPIFGYHVYRAPSAAGPWTSMAYVLAPTTSYFDGTAVFPMQYYVVLPYSDATTAFGAGNQGNYTGTSHDGVWVASDGGVHEAALGAATAVGYDPNSGCSPTFSPTASWSPTPSPSNTPSFSPSPTASFTPTVSQTYTPSPTFSVSPSASPTAPGTFTISPTVSNTPPGTLTDTPTPSASASATPPNSPTFTATQTPFFTNTASPTVTAVVLGPGTQIYPNPFDPDKGEVFHIGNITAGDTMTIYNLIGELVYSVRLKGDPTQDVWDGLNNNGVKVVTGVYFLVLSGSQHQVFRVAVVREVK